MNRQESINRFIAVSYLYFRLTDKSSEYINAEELEELMPTTSPCCAPTST